MVKVWIAGPGDTASIWLFTAIAGPLTDARLSISNLYMTLKSPPLPANFGFLQLSSSVGVGFS
jgi:hypothetical protein